MRNKRGMTAGRAFSLRSSFLAMLLACALVLQAAPVFAADGDTGSDPYGIMRLEELWSEAKTAVGSAVDLVVARVKASGIAEAVAGAIEEKLGEAKEKLNDVKIKIDLLKLLVSQAGGVISDAVRTRIAEEGKEAKSKLESVKLAIELVKPMIENVGGRIEDTVKEKLLETLGEAKKKIEDVAKEIKKVEEKAAAAQKEEQEKAEAAKQEAAKKAAVEAFSLNVKKNATVPVQKGKKVAKIVATLGAGDALDKVVSSDSKIVKAGKSGKKIWLKGLKVSKKAVVITVTTKYGATWKFKVKVQKKPVKTKKIVIRNKPKTMKVGKKINLKLEITPITTSQATKIISSDKKVATVTKTGTVKAKKRGTATITVKSGKVKKKLTIKITK